MRKDNHGATLEQRHQIELILLEARQTAELLAHSKNLSRETLISNIVLNAKTSASIFNSNSKRHKFLAQTYGFLLPIFWRQNPGSPQAEFYAELVDQMRKAADECDPSDEQSKIGND